MIKNKLISILLIIAVFLSGCVHKNIVVPPLINQPTITNTINYDIVEKIAELPILDENSINTFENYRVFADNVNYLIDILKEKTEFNIPKLETTFEGYKKVSDVITKYAPLVNNYNGIIKAAKDVANKKDAQSLENFYKSVAIFGAEIAIIYAAVFALPVYTGIGTVYRASGIQTLAFKCATCVKVALSESHWFVRTILVEGSSQLLRAAIEGVQYLYDNGIKIEDFENNFEQFKNNILAKYTSLNITIPLYKPS